MDSESEDIGESVIPLDQEPESSLQIYREVFDLCDRDANGFISKDELSVICQQVSDEEVASSLLDNVMTCLDSDHDGHISFEEFKAGFQAFKELQTNRVNPVLPSNSLHSLPHSTPHNHNHKKMSVVEVYESDPVPDAEEAAWREVAERIDPQGTLQGTGVDSVWKELNQRDPGLLHSFETFMSQVISELKQSDLEKSTLQNHVKRVLEQHNKEVTEMDHLLQEELQLAKANQQQSNASQTSRLSSHYSSLLADREAVIHELSTQETGLKQALQKKALTESQLKQEKSELLNVNRALKEQLVTTQHSDSGSGSGNEAAHSQQWQDSVGEEEEEDRDEEDGVESSETERQQSDSSIEHHLHLPEHRIMVSPQASLSLNVVECGEEDEAKYYPPKKSPAHYSSNQNSLSNRSDEPSRARRQLQTDGPECRESSEGFSKESSPEVLSVSPEGWVVTKPVSSGKRISSQPTHTDNMAFNIPGGMAVGDGFPSPSPGPNPSLNRVFKVVFLGESGVGKSSLIAFLSEGKFSTSVKSTVGLDYSVKTLCVGEERVVFQLWDTAGQERFMNALTPVYFRRADAFVIVYDVTNVSSFKAIKKWISVIKAALRELPSVIMLVGNKSDQMQERCVGIEDGRRLALELQALFSETSALSGDNVLQAHSTLAQLLLARENADLQRIKSKAINVEKKRCSC